MLLSDKFKLFGDTSASKDAAVSQELKARVHRRLIERLDFGKLDVLASGELASEIAARAPLAVRLGKEAVNGAFESFLSDGIADERRSFYILFASQDQKEGMAAFIEKRPPEWKGT